MEIHVSAHERRNRVKDGTHNVRSHSRSTRKIEFCAGREKTPWWKEDDKQFSEGRVEDYVENPEGVWTRKQDVKPRTDDTILGDGDESGDKDILGGPYTQTVETMEKTIPFSTRRKRFSLPRGDDLTPENQEEVDEMVRREATRHHPGEDKGEKILQRKKYDNPKLGGWSS